MTTDSQGTLVLKDEAGDYFLLPQTMLERGRVSEEHKAEVEQLIQDMDVSGHFMSRNQFLAIFSTDPYERLAARLLVGYYG